MGKIIINETDEKQKVELTTDAEGVSGGYYDSEGNWNEFGGGANPYIGTTWKLKTTSESQTSDRFTIPIEAEFTVGSYTYASFTFNKNSNSNSTIVAVNVDKAQLGLTATTTSNTTIRESSGAVASAYRNTVFTITGGTYIDDVIDLFKKEFEEVVE